jgi:hypothetical protein
MRNDEMLYSLLCILVLFLILPFSSHADTFCVSDATELQTVLTTAASNAEDDTIQIVQGNYVGSFLYSSVEVYSLTVEGGYMESCVLRILDPANTVLNANGIGSVFVFSATHTNANLEVDGLTLIFFCATYIPIAPDGGGDLIMARVRFQSVTEVEGVTIVEIGPTSGVGGCIYGESGNRYHPDFHSITVNLL